MIDRELFENILDEVACELPQAFYEKLNGGIIISDEEKKHERSSSLCVMGEYHHSNQIGSHIVIYYGSFNRMYPNITVEMLRKHLRETLRHEFRHHIETLAGENELAKIDKQSINIILGRK